VLVLAVTMPASASSIPSPAPDAAGAVGPCIEVFLLESRVFGNRRTIRVLLPPGYGDPASRALRYPVMYFNDGFAVFKPGAWNAPEIVGRLESEGRIRPLIVVGIDNGATAENGSADQRTLEYVPYADARYEPRVPAPRGNRYPEFLVEEVMPEIASRYRVSPRPKDTGVGGASYGALAALYAVVHRPGVFGRLLLESTPVFLSDFAALREAREARIWPAQISIGIGTRETDDEALAKTAGPLMEDLRDIIRGSGARSRVRLSIDPGATHGATAWRERLPAALEFLWANP